MATAFVYDPIFMEHRPPSKHVESPQRVEAIFAQLERLHWLDRPDVLRLEPRPATEDELAAAHTREHIRAMAGRATAMRWCGPQATMPRRIALWVFASSITLPLPRAI